MSMYLLMTICFQVSTPAYNNKIDEGHSLSRGRGFSSFDNDDGKLLNKYFKKYFGLSSPKKKNIQNF